MHGCLSERSSFSGDEIGLAVVSCSAAKNLASRSSALFASLWLEIVLFIGRFPTWFVPLSGSSSSAPKPANRLLLLAPEVFVSGETSFSVVLPELSGEGKECSFDESHAWSQASAFPFGDAPYTAFRCL